MKHAILITAYKDFKQLLRLVLEFDNQFNIYIHIDKKSKIGKEAYENISKNPNIKFITQKYKINWGGINHLKAYLLLSEKALQNKENTYFHLITGQDYPIKNTEYFNKLFSNNINYLEHAKMPALNLWKTDGGMGRLHYYNFYDWFNARSIFGKKCLAFIRKLQVKLKVRRSINIKEQLYGGSTYWSLSRDILQYVIYFTNQNPTFLKRFKYIFCPEEMYFQTIIMNSKHAKDVTNDNLRFIDWKGGENGGPSFLNETDYERIVTSNKLFARKIDSDKLKLMLSVSNK